MDDLGDYLEFSFPRPPSRRRGGSPQVDAEDPQLNAIREHSRIVMKRLQRAIEAIGKAEPRTDDLRGRTVIYIESGPAVADAQATVSCLQPLCSRSL
jgi:hypothetical protein